MQVKRFVADDTRSAMRLVKDEIGSDAVILSNRVVDGKVEILAARDYDENLINQALDKTLIENKPDGAAAYYERKAAQRSLEMTDELSQIDVSSSKISTSEIHKEVITQEDEPNAVTSFDDVNNKIIEKQTLTESVQKTSLQKPVYDSSSYDPFKLNSEHQAAGLYQAQKKQIEKTSLFTDSMTAMHDELKSLRTMIENQNILGEWQELTAKYPLRVNLYKRLTKLGLSQEVCKYLAKGLDNSANIDHAMNAALKQLVHQLPIAGEDILNTGGVYAMVGPTGVGKTTTIAKLAARFAMQHGARHVALISTDTYRIGAHEQLMTYGRLLGVPVHVVNDSCELQPLLHKLQDKKLVLIDTAGMSQRDIDISQQLAHLSGSSAMIKSYLVLSANAQLSTLEEVITNFKKANLAGCVLTKLDEAASLGGILSALIKHRLAVAFTSNGQKVPEDIQAARAKDLVDLALAYAKQHKEPIDEDFMAVAFTSGMRHASL